MQIWQVLVSIGGLAVPIVLAAMARDRALMTMITGTRTDWQNAIGTVNARRPRPSRHSTQRPTSD